MTWPDAVVAAIFLLSCLGLARLLIPRQSNLHTDAVAAALLPEVSNQISRELAQLDGNPGHLSVTVEVKVRHVT